MSFVQHVVRDAKMAGGKHFFVEAIVGKSSRLTHQTVDHMAVVNRKAVLANKAWHRLYKVTPITHPYRFGFNPNVDFATDQSAGDRVSIGAYLNRATAVNAHAEVVGDVEPLVGQTLQNGLLLSETPLAMSVGLGDGRFDKSHVVFTANEGPTPTQQQRLIESLFDVIVRRLHVAVFIGTPRVGPFGFAVIVFHQRAVSRGVQFATGMVVDRSAERVAAVTLGRTAKFPKCFLNPRAQ